MPGWAGLRKSNCMTSLRFKSPLCLSPTGGMKPHLFPLILAGLAVVAALAGEPGSLWLRFQADAIWSGEIWRLVTAHLAHLGWSHTLMNMAGLALVWWLVGPLLRTRASSSRRGRRTSPPRHESALHPCGCPYRSAC